MLSIKDATICYIYRSIKEQMKTRISHFPVNFNPARTSECPPFYLLKDFLDLLNHDFHFLVQAWILLILKRYVKRYYSVDNIMYNFHASFYFLFSAKIDAYKNGHIIAMPKAPYISIKNYYLGATYVIANRLESNISRISVS